MSSSQMEAMKNLRFMQMTWDMLLENPSNWLLKSAEKTLLTSVVVKHLKFEPAFLNIIFVIILSPPITES